ncbi:MAG: hypothetical protein MUF51_01420 [Vicinamibacteria bacterium]|nr:hypothetical protein [Vicinamibacteria bacterium]
MQDQVEWLNNRYNPGYFLGGTLRPELRLATLGWHAKRVAGALALVSGVGMLLLGVMLLVLYHVPDPWTLILGMLQFMAGIKILESAADQRPANDATGFVEEQAVRRIVGQMVLGVVLVAAISAAIVLAVAAIASIRTGAFGIVAAVSVLIAIILIRRQPNDQRHADNSNPQA